MKRLPNNALAKAIIAFLKANLEIPVYDNVPEDAARPFVSLGAITVRDQSSKTDDLTHMTAHIHIWSDYEGRYEVNNIAEELINLLGSEQLDLSTDGFYVNAQGVDFYETYPEDDDGFNGAINLELLIQNVKEEA